MTELYAARFARVTQNLAAQGLSQMIVSDPPTIFYLTGIRLNPGERMLALLLRADGAHRFFVNALFGQPDAGFRSRTTLMARTPPPSFCRGWNGTNRWASTRTGPRGS